MSIEFEAKQSCTFIALRHGVFKNARGEEVEYYSLLVMVPDHDAPIAMKISRDCAAALPLFDVGTPLLLSLSMSVWADKPQFRVVGVALG